MESQSEDRTEAETLRRLSALLDDFEGTRVTLIGDVMLDRYHHGYANNLNSTAPVPALRIIRSEESPGAAAHIARGLNSLGMEVDFFSCVGDDAEGNMIIEMISNDGIETSGIVVVPNRKTLTKIRFYGSRESLLDQSQVLLQADRGPLEELSKSVSDQLIDAALESMPNSKAIVLSDYDKGVLSESGASKLISTAKKLKLPCIVDPKLTGLSRSQGADAVIFGMRGLELQRRRLMLESTSETASELISTYGWGAIVVLGGVEGTNLYLPDGGEMAIPCRANAPRQQIGLHDAAATALAAALGNGLDIMDATSLAAAACECVLTAESSQEFVDSDTLGVWLDELSWKLQISDR
jgi:D-beta-D-heptose 7-phosphate kinase/D-beta-D-heptose 1-phosphate adenosyltransferase